MFQLTEIVVIILNINGIDEITEFIAELKVKYADNGKCLLITDMIHFIKNRRSQIKFLHIKMNNEDVSVDDLYFILGDSAAIFII